MMVSRTMRLLSLITFLASATVVALVPQAAHATTTIYTNEATFLASVAPGFYAEDFAGVPFGPIGNYGLSQNGFSYTVHSSDSNGAWGNPATDPTNIQTFEANTSLIFSITSGNVTAVGGNFYDGDGVGNYLSAAPETVTLSDGTSFTVTPTSAKDPSEFIGFVSDGSITSVTVTGASILNTCSLFVVGQAPSGSIVTPESNTGLLCLLAVPLLTAGAIVRRYKTSS